LDTDVLISGAGMVGATLACALAAGGLRVVVVEAREVRSFDSKSSYDLRVSAVSPGSDQILQALEVWDLIQKYRLCPYHQMHVWDAAGEGEIHFDALDIGEPYLGHIIENHVIQVALHERLHSLKNISMRCPDAVRSFQANSNHIEVKLDSGSCLRSKLLVGADGSASRIRSMSGITFQAHSYTQDAVVANVNTEQDHLNTAWQRFLSTGPLALLPLANGQCSVVWSTTREYAEAMVGQTDEDFCEALTQASDYRLGRVIATSPRAMFPLRGGQASPYVLPRIALVGDAAHSIHPLAGQGVNLGFKDAAALADVLLEAQHDIGSLRVLRRYERARVGDNILTMHTMEGFKALFSNTVTPLVMLRSVGLMIANAVGPIKYSLMRHAMGIAGERPKLVLRRRL
jgi:2-octaprenylphenol hydroxylase